MANPERNTSHSKPWTDLQAYLLAAFCLVLGVALGYLFRGSASPAAASVQAAASAGSSMPQGQAPQAQVTPEQQKAIVEQAVAPLLTTLKTSPDDLNTIVQLANLYYDGQQYPEAVKYYQLAVKSQPTNPDLLTDLGTSIWYMGDADGAIAQFQTALKYKPDHPGTLFNLGIVRWQGKLDPKGAVQAWEELLRLNPNYPQRQEVQEYIDRAKQHAKG
ncbi:MAG TPA: tetratricopeptide repeat protein [Candidatus Acidoferrum sp.]|nr:tetratricopeptide repeat protein [Candidatus Acidoferrum sp.]